MADQSKHACISVHFDSGELEVVAVNAFGSEKAKGLVHESWMVDRHGEFDMATVTRAAEFIEVACCAPGEMSALEMRFKRCILSCIPVVHKSAKGSIVEASGNRIEKRIKCRWVHDALYRECPDVMRR